MRLTGLFASLLLIAGCAPTGAQGPGDVGMSARRCFTPVGVQLIKFEPGAGVYVRTRSGETLQLTGPAACLTVTEDDPRIGLRALGLETADLCIGDAARLEIRSHSTIARTCNVDIARVVSNDEINRLADRQSP